MARQYDQEFKDQVVRLVLEAQKPGAEVAREVGIPAKTVHSYTRLPGQAAFVSFPHGSSWRLAKPAHRTQHD